MKRVFLQASLLMLALMLIPTLEADAQKKKKKGKKDETETPKKKDEGKSVDELTKSCVKFEGLFNIYQDTTSGSTWLEVSKEQLNKEYIYFSYVENGVLDAGFFRGNYRGSKVITFEKYYDRIEIYTENTSYYYDENNALSKAADVNINRPMIISEKIEANGNDSIFLISGDDIFLSEQFQMVKPPSNPKFPSFLGKLSQEKSKVNKINNYPENSEITVTYVYDNPNPRNYGSSAVTDVRSINVKYQHSLLEMPENNFVPRRDDARIGFFNTQVNDMTTFEAANYKDMIHRWHLEKKDPSAALSDPVEPITFWIENTTPEAYRPIIKAGVERWNEAFETAGFTNAVVVKIQPDDAEWDAGDIRYNVLRWTSSPMPPFGGYGPSFVNPRTGQILGADIMLEFVSVTNRLRRTEVFRLAGFDASGEFDPEAEENVQFSNNPHACQIGDCMHHNYIFGLSAMRTMDVDQSAEDEFVNQTLSRLVLHEVGHTLGMMHNMHASTLQSVEDIKNKEKIEAEGLCNSVMEYPAVNYALNKEDQTLYYDDKPGFYDHWVIEYGYSQGLEDPEAEEARLEKILSRSNDPKLEFGNDADDMRSPGKAIDPDVNIYDLSDDPVAYGIERCELVNKVLPKLMDEYIEDDNTYQDFYIAYMIATGEYATQIGVMTRQIGGVHFDRSLPGQGSEKKPLQPVSRAKQKAAMDALTKYAFAPDAFEVDGEIYNHLLRQRRGFNHFVNTDDPKIHSRTLMMQSMCLYHLLSSSVQTRITDSELYGNEYPLDEMMTDLTNAIFRADLKSAVNTQRQNLQVYYVQRLIGIVDGKSRYNNVSKGMALYELERIDKMMASAASPNTSTKAHRAYVRKLIDESEDIILR